MARRVSSFVFAALLLLLFLAFRDSDVFGYALTAWGIWFVLFGVGARRRPRSVRPGTAPPTPPIDAT